MNNHSSNANANSSAANVRSGQSVNLRPLPATNNLTAKPTLLCLLKALRKRALIAIVIGLIVGGLVGGALWWFIPASTHTAVAKVLIPEVKFSPVFPPEKEPNFAT